MRKLWPVVLVLFFLGACAPATLSKSQLPPEVEMGYGHYPVLPIKHMMTAGEVQRFGLEVGKLEKDTLVFNHYRALGPDGGWKAEILKAGTWVAKDKSGRVWYKLDCANRLYQPVRVCPVCPAGWNPFGSGGPRWPWWLPWLAALPLLGLLAWLLGGRKREEESSLPGNGDGGGHGPGGPREDPHLGIDPAVRPPAPVDPNADRRAALERDVAVATTAAEAYEVEAARLRGQFDPAGDPDKEIALLGRIVVEEEAGKAARESATAKQAELDALGVATPPSPPVQPAPAPAPAPQPAPAPDPPTDDKATLLASLRRAEKEAGVRHRAIRVAIDALEKGAMTPAEARAWLQKLGVTLA